MRQISDSSQTKKKKKKSGLCCFTLILRKNFIFTLYKSDFNLEANLAIQIKALTPTTEPTASSSICTTSFDPTARAQRLGSRNPKLEHGVCQKTFFLNAKYSVIFNLLIANAEVLV